MADRTLIEGQYRATVSNTSDIEFAKGMIRIADIVKDWKLPRAAKKQQDDMLAAEVVNQNGELPASYVKATEEHLQEGKDQYINGTEQDKALAMRDQNMLTNELMELQETRLQLANSQAPTESNYQALIDNNTVMSNAFRDPYNPNNEIITKLLSEEDNLIIQGGKAGMEIGGKFLSVAEIKNSMIYRDETSRKNVQNAYDSYVQLGAKQASSPSKFFNYNVTELDVRDKILKPGNLVSLAVDPMKNDTDILLPDMDAQTTWYNQAVEALVNPDRITSLKNINSYQKAADQKGVNWKDGYSLEEAHSVVRNMVYNPLFKKNLEDELAFYYTDMARKGYEVGFGTREERLNRDAEKQIYKQDLADRVEKLRLERDEEKEKNEKKDITQMFNSEAE